MAAGAVLFGAYLTGDAERYRTAHVLFGYAAAGLVAFRLAYARSLLAAVPQHFTGHNPLGSWAVLHPLALIALACVTGIAAYLEIGGEDFEDVHEVLANAALALVGAVAAFWGGAFKAPGMRETPGRSASGARPTIGT